MSLIGQRSAGGMEASSDSSVDSEGVPTSTENPRALCEALVQSGFPLITPEEIAEGVIRAITSEGTGEAWVCQAGREPLRYEFRGVPGPRTPGKEGMAPPDFRA